MDITIANNLFYTDVLANKYLLIHKLISIFLLQLREIVSEF